MVGINECGCNKTHTWTGTWIKVPAQWEGEDGGSLTCAISFGEQPAEICVYFGSCGVVQLQRHDLSLHPSSYASSSGIIITNIICCRCPPPGAVPASTSIDIHPFARGGKKKKNKTWLPIPAITSPRWRTTSWACPADRHLLCWWTVQNTAPIFNLPALQVLPFFSVRFH